LSIIVQLPELYLRGSLATETMANLTEEEQKEAGEIAVRIANHPSMEKHKARYIRDMRATIGGDYRNSDAAEHDYNIVVWRGVVMLKYHKRYEFRCTKCKSTTYLTKSNTEASIRKRTKICPACKTEAEDGKSPIEVIVLKPVHENPDAILSVDGDETQMTKLFGQILSNSTRQQLRENPIKTVKRENSVVDYADIQILNQLDNILNRHKISSNKVKTEHGYSIIHYIYFDANAASSKLIGSLVDLQIIAQNNCVKYEMNSTGLKISRTAATKQIQRTVVEKIHVKMAIAGARKPNAPNPLEVEHPSERPIDEQIESNEFLETLDEMCPSENVRAIMQIQMQMGDYYEKYRKEYGEGKPVFKNIAKFLGVSKNQVDLCRNQLTWLIKQLQEETQIGKKKQKENYLKKIT